MSLTSEQSMALVGQRVRIINPPAESPELRGKTGVVWIIADESKCLLQMDDGSPVNIDAADIQPV